MIELYKPNMDETSERFWKRIDKRGPDECWNWIGPVKGHGYGQFFFYKRNRRAHRVSWELTTGQPIPAGKVLCHACDNPRCVNPAHLFIGSQKENIRDAETKGRLFNPWKTRTQCSRGHEYTVENTQYKVGKNGCNERVCLACKKLRSEARYLRKKVNPSS